MGWNSFHIELRHSRWVHVVNKSEESTWTTCERKNTSHWLWAFCALWFLRSASVVLVLLEIRTQDWNITVKRLLSRRRKFSSRQTFIHLWPKWWCGGFEEILNRKKTSRRQSTVEEQRAILFITKMERDRIRDWTQHTFFGIPPRLSSFLPWYTVFLFGIWSSLVSGLIRSSVAQFCWECWCSSFFCTVNLSVISETEKTGLCRWNQVLRALSLLRHPWEDNQMDTRWSTWQSPISSVSTACPHDHHCYHCCYCYCYWRQHHH